VCIVAIDIAAVTLAPGMRVSTNAGLDAGLPTDVLIATLGSDTGSPTGPRRGLVTACALAAQSETVVTADEMPVR
jgi:hypothetical protein